ITFSELAAEAERAAATLIRLGVRPGDRVALWAPNMWEWPVIALGVTLSGAILVPVNTRFRGLEAAYVLERSGAKLLFTVEEFLGVEYPRMLREADRPLPELNAVLSLRGQGASTAGVVSYQEI